MMGLYPGKNPGLLAGHFELNDQVKSLNLGFIICEQGKISAQITSTIRRPFVHSLTQHLADI